VGGIPRRAALKVLAQSPDPGAADALVEDGDGDSPSSNAARTIFAANSDPAWNDRCWELGAERRQLWLGKLLRERVTPHSQRDSAFGVLSQLKLGQGGLLQDAPTMAAVASHWRDLDSEVQAVSGSACSAVLHTCQPARLQWRFARGSAHSGAK